VKRVLRALSVALLLAALLTPPVSAPVSAGDPVLVGAGDIASCRSTGDSATARLLDSIPGLVYTLGDNAYGSGTWAEFVYCYHPTWGRHRWRTRPAPGNHDYLTRGAAGYYRYFGQNAGDPSRGYYSYNRGAWHIIALNSNCAAVGGCYRGSRQERWLRADLAAHRTACTLAYWHHPRFSSGPHGGSSAYQPFWEALYDYNADVVLAGHDHLYERFAPQNARGDYAPYRGLRQFVVGTGGRSLYNFSTVRRNSQIRGRSYGVLKLTLHARSYDWQFVPVPGSTFRDAGRGYCH
jgi:hypothetical protein